MRRARAISVSSVLVLAALVTACGSSGPGDRGEGTPTASTPTAATPIARPRSTARLAIVTPREGQVVRGSSVRLRISLGRAELVRATSTDVRPDEGHLHVLVDDTLVSMTSGLEQRIGNLRPGPHLIKVEFVASDHAPFDPRVIVAVSFEVAP